MSDELTNDQIALLCTIGEQKLLDIADDKQADLQVLLTGGYVMRKQGQPGSGFQLTPKAMNFLGERGAGLNEA